MPQYYFDANLNTVPGTPDDASSAWTGEANMSTPTTILVNNTNTISSDTTLGSTSTKFLYVKGTNVPSSGPPIRAVRVRIASARISSGTAVGGVVYTAALAETLGSMLGPSTTGAVDYGRFTELLRPAAGWSWPTIQALEMKIYDSVGDGTFAAFFNYVEIAIDSLHNTWGNAGKYMAVSDGMSRGEVAN